MSIWQRLLGRDSADSLTPQRLDYLNEGLALERQGDYEAALTSYRLAFRDNPSDSRILLNMAIAFTKTGQPEEAIRHYKRALELDPGLVGAHYGVAFLLIKRGDVQQAADGAMFRHVGVEPAAQSVLLLKSSVHFRADFGPLASEVLIVRAPGPSPADPADLVYRRLRKGVRQSPRH